MDLIVVMFLIYLGGPIGLFLIAMCGLALRDLRSKRALLLLAAFVPLAVAAVWGLSSGFGAMGPPYDAIPDWAKAVHNVIEVAAVASVPAIGLAAIALLVPPPHDRTRAVWFGVIGLIALAVAGLALYALSGTNFGL